ncbi:amino acid ABC transporter substrate-binding protein, partial [Pseudomonas sp. GW460-8]
YYDGQGFMVKKSGIRTVKDLNRATICFQSATTTEANLAEYFRANGLRFIPLSLDTADQAKAAFLGGKCDALTGDISSLHVIMASNP